MKKVAITGLLGFTGGYVKAALETKGYEVVGIKSDITDGIELSHELEDISPDAVIHLAAISFPAHSDYREMYEVNLHGSVNLFRAIKKTKSIKKTVVASSSNVYGEYEGKIDESFCTNPINHYGISKLAMERAAVSEGVECIIVRAFNYTGVGQAEHFLIPKIVSHFKAKKESIELGNLDVARDFSDVRWVSAVYAALIEADIKSGVFNVCSQRAITLKEIIAAAERLCGYKIKVSVNQNFVRKNEIKNLFGSNKKLFDALKNLPAPIDIEQTLEWMIKEVEY